MRYQEKEELEFKAFTVCQYDDLLHWEEEIKKKSYP